MTYHQSISVRYEKEKITITMRPQIILVEQTGQFNPKFLYFSPTSYSFLKMLHYLVTSKVHQGSLNLFTSVTLVSVLLICMFMSLRFASVYSTCGPNLDN